MTTKQDDPSIEHIKPGFFKRRPVQLLLAALLVILLAAGSYAGYLYAASPAAIRTPKLAHHHFRMQILVNGNSVNFGEQKYQTAYEKGSCSAELPEQPVHFHDNKDQFVHIHWDNMTGGMVMKNYGWNFVGGMDNALGYKLDNLREVRKVDTHGNVLPSIPDNAQFYIYIGDKDGYSEKSFDDWKTQDLEQFFGKKSNLPEPEEISFLSKLFPTAYAHGGEVHAESNGDKTEEELTRINNLIGNVVIFVQKDEPTDEQIKSQFNKLVPLSDSTCGG